MGFFYNYDYSAHIENVAYIDNHQIKIYNNKLNAKRRSLIESDYNKKSLFREIVPYIMQYEYYISIRYKNQLKTNNQQDKYFII